MPETITLKSLLGDNLEDNFLEFDLTEIQGILQNLSNTDVIDIAHAEFLQQQTLRGADILSEFLGKIIKTTSYLESKINTTKNKVSLEYKDPEGNRTTAEMKKWAGESSQDVADIHILLSKAKGSKALLEKKYDIIIRAHHYYKDLSSGLKKGIVSYNPTKNDNSW